ncbi:coiled-coil domain-containing protein 63 [Willisornis vidua]|uniref:Coiled-coil domain-containing protein 63 n=1 Tax=Willisornis vidua TaxID=1566151 RepID=A0ABQ9DIF1_9PASS|nr:coiled-coil domain-containing protein 63 [Willisornis vidua]
METQRKPSKSQDLSELSEHEKERRAKMEIKKLQTQYHHAAYKRKFYDAEIWRQIKAQQKAIDDLNQEHRHVSLMLSQIYSPNNVMLENRNRVKVQTLFQTKIQNEALIKERKAQLDDLGRQVLELEKKITKQREITVRALQARNHKRLQEQIDALEFRLNRITVHYNTILTRIDELREETRSLQIQKAIFDNYYWKYERQLTQQNRELDSSVEQATEDYEQWMEYLSKISDIREARYKDTIQYNIKMLELKCALHQETRLKNFYLTKCTDLSDLKEQAKQREALKAAELAKQSQAESYEVAYKRLLELSDGDIDQLLDDFVEKDRRFFILFAYGIRLNVRNEGLKQRIKDIQDDMAATTMEWEQAEATRVNVLQELEAKLTETIEEANHYEAKCKESSKLLGQLQSRMESLLTGLDCDTTKIVKPLGSSLLMLFGPVEEKIDDFLMLESLLRFTSIDRAHRSQSFISPTSGNAGLLWVLDRGKLCPLPPDLDSTDPGTAEEPLDKGQLRRMVIKRHEEQLASPPSMSKKRRRTLSKSPVRGK